jgi:hypothetical protein
MPHAYAARAHPKKVSYMSRTTRTLARAHVQQLYSGDSRMKKLFPFFVIVFLLTGCNLPGSAPDSAATLQAIRELR